MEIRSEISRFSDPRRGNHIEEVLRFLRDGELSPNTLRPLIAESWWRCHRAGVHPEWIHSSQPSAAGEWVSAKPANRDLAGASLPVMTEARDFLSESGTIMILADASGFVLGTSGDDKAIDAAADVGLATGGNWSETSRGTNAIGTSLFVGGLVHIHAIEHYCKDAKQWTSAATVIRDPVDRTLLGAVSVAGLDESFNPHLLALAVATAGRIEASLAGRETELRERLLEHGLATIARTSSHGLVVFDRRGRFVTADARARLTLAAMGVAQGLEAHVRVGALDITASEDSRETSLPDWLRPEWLEPVEANEERIGTSVLLPETLRRGSVVSKGGLPRYKLRRAAEFIEAHASQVIRIEDIARSVGVSRYHFHRQFKKSTGLTPHQYIVQKRIDRAKSLLSRSDLPIIEVGARVGFADQSHFTTTFRKLTSMTPRAYRFATRV